MEKSILTPKEIAQSSISVAENKANMVWWRQFLLAIMAGLFIGLAGNGASITAYSVPAAGMSKMLSGVLFGTGLILVLMAGAELFTGNSLMLIGVAEKKIRISAMLRNWVIVYIGNFIGGVGLAWCISQTTQFGCFLQYPGVPCSLGKLGRKRYGVQNHWIIFSNLAVCNIRL